MRTPVTFPSRPTSVVPRHRKVAEPQVSSEAAESTKALVGGCELSAQTEGDVAAGSRSVSGEESRSGGRMRTGRVRAVRVLLSEGSSLTAREVVIWLGSVGFHIEALDPGPLCLARFSRWMRKVHRCPRSGANPLGYLAFLKQVVDERRIDVVMTTHEQAWLFAAASRLPPDVPLAVADIASYVVWRGRSSSRA
jgi:hypothetical protein